MTVVTKSMAAAVADNLLSWQDVKEFPGWSASDGAGNWYWIEAHAGPDRSPLYRVTIGFSAIGDEGSLDEAKRLAQDHHRAAQAGKAQ